MASSSNPSSIARRDAILNATAAVLAREGLDGTAIETVAREAGVAKQTLYNYFGGRTPLLLALLDSRLDDANRRVTEAMTAALDDCANVTDALVILGVRWNEILLEPELAAIRRAIIAGAGRFPELFAAWGDRGPEPSIRLLAGKLAILSQRGQLTRLGEPVRAARQLLILLTAEPMNLSLLGQIPLDHNTLTNSVAANVDLFLRAVG